MVTRNLKCFECDYEEERTAIGMAEPSTICSHCGGSMEQMPTAPSGFKFRGPGFHCVDYPKSNEQLKKDYGLDKHDSTNPDADYHQEGYAEEMVSHAPSVNRGKKKT